MREKLSGDAPCHPHVSPGDTARTHVQHCFDQLVRFASMRAGFADRAVQFGMNLGRAQEILGAEGGVDCWWRMFEPHLTNRPALLELCLAYVDALGLDYPPAFRSLSYDSAAALIRSVDGECKSSREVWNASSLVVRDFSIRATELSKVAKDMHLTVTVRVEELAGFPLPERAAPGEAK